jgi:glycine/serine hydroxymethyltransferase
VETDMTAIADLIGRAVLDADGSQAADIQREVAALVARRPAYARP